MKGTLAVSDRIDRVLTNHRPALLVFTRIVRGMFRGKKANKGGCKN